MPKQKKAAPAATKKVAAKKTKAPAKLTDKAILEAFGEISAAIAGLALQVKELRGEEPEGETEVEEAAEEAVVMVRRPDGKMVAKSQVEATPTNPNGRYKQPAPKPQQKVAAKVATTASEIKARYELWAYDEYNQGSIVNAGPRLDKVIEAAKKFVTEQNVDNALAAGEKDKSWEAYFPQVFVDGEETNDVLYAGNKRDGKHYVYVRGEEKWELRRPDASVQFKFFLGNTSNGRVKSEWYLTDHRGREINSITDIALERKTVLFVKVI